MQKSFFILLILMTSLSAYSQRLEGKEEVKSVVVKDDKKKRKSPARAAIYSAILPGAGQVYNKKYWKLPLVYGAIGTSFYLSQFYQDKFIKYRNIYRLEMDGDSTTVSEFHEKIKNNTVSLSGIKNIRDTYRSWMELSYIFTGLFYVMQIVDASVDAHFTEFDVSDNLTMNVSPVFLSSRAQRGPITGLSLRLTIK